MKKVTCDSLFTFNGGKRLIIYMSQGDTYSDAL